MTSIINFNKKIGARIRDIRKEKKLEIEDMLVKLNVSESTYLRIEKGETSTWSGYLEKICQILEINEEELFLSKDQFVQINKGRTSGDGNNGSGIIIINQAAENFYEYIKNDATTIANLKNENQKLREELKKLNK